MPFSAYDVVEISDVEDMEHDPALSMEDDLRVQMTGQLTSVIDKVTMFLSFFHNNSNNPSPFEIEFHFLV